MSEVEIHGFCEDRFKQVEEAFHLNFQQGHEIGASAAIVHEGKLVVDLWGGYMNSQRTLAWEKETLVNVYSTTKIMGALCLHILADRNQIDLDAPIATYWPEFAQASKERMPVKYILSHTTGIPGFSEKIPVEALYDWDRMAKMIAAEKPWWKPGTRSGYQSITFSFLVGELVKRVSGKTIGTFFREEIANPLNIDFHIGTPQEFDHRIAELVGKPVPRWQKAVVKLFTPMIAKVIFNPDPNELIPKANTREWRAAELTSSNGHGNARSIAHVGAILACGGTYQGKHVLSSETVDRAIQPQIKNFDKSTFTPIEWGLGYELNPRRYKLGPRTFSWGGYGGSKCVMDRDLRISVGYAMNRLEANLLSDKRAVNLVEATRKSLGL
jgi:CubicO group peptidase (beta-lactamase class C family)